MGRSFCAAGQLSTSQHVVFAGLPAGRDRQPRGKSQSRVESTQSVLTGQHGKHGKGMYRASSSDAALPFAWPIAWPCSQPLRAPTLCGPPVVRLTACPAAADAPGPCWRWLSAPRADPVAAVLPPAAFGHDNFVEEREGISVATVRAALRIRMCLQITRVCADGAALDGGLCRGTWSHVTID
jgi:hypothetical protein